MGQHVWLLLATIVTELLVITKWARGQYSEPLPEHVKWAWIAGGTVLVLYPIVRVHIYLVLLAENSLLMVMTVSVRDPIDEAIPAEVQEEKEQDEVVAW
jgi:hypothetical protein